MVRQNIPLGRILGIPIALDYSWFVIFALLTWSLAGNYYPAEFKSWGPPLYWVMGALTALMLFASVLLHEPGHSVVALRYKIPVRSITLFIFGDVAQVSADPPAPWRKFSWPSLAPSLVSSDRQNAVGLITPHRVKEVPRQAWATTSASQAMLPLEKFKRISPSAELWSALQEMER